MIIGLQFFGGRGSGSGAGGGFVNANFQILQQPPNILQTQQQVQQANARTFDDTDSRPFHDLAGGRNYFQSQNLTIDEQLSIINYISPTTESGSLYSMAQNMNYALAKGTKLTANQQYVSDNLNNAMHNLGENLNLQRYDHDTMINGLLRQAGVNQNYQNLSASQLQNALVGRTFIDSKFVSTSHNDFRRAVDASTFTSRAVKINYHAPASTQALMVGNSYVMRNGRPVSNPLGEIVLKPKQNYQITGVRFNGNTARRQGTQTYSLPQVEIDIDIIG